MTLSKDELFEMLEATYQKACVVYESFWKAEKASDFAEANRLHRLHSELTIEHAEICELLRKLIK